MPHRLHVLIQGRVQGVGFRYATYREAHALGLHGWVRNLPGGKVEAEFEGPKDVLEQMLDWCRQGPSLARVGNVAVEWSSGMAVHTDFVIRG